MRSSGHAATATPSACAPAPTCSPPCWSREAAKLPAKRWATVAPNYEYGQSAVRWFKELLTRARPDVTFVAEQFPALGRIDAGATVQALAAANPEAIFNVTFGADLTNFVRQGLTRGLFEKRRVVSLLTGEPEYLDPLQDEAPENWIVTGYPWDQIQHAGARHLPRRLPQALERLSPRLGSVVGYDTVMAIAARCCGRPRLSRPRRWSTPWPG